MALLKSLSKIVAIIGVSLVVCTIISLLHDTSRWFIQVFNFPRLQALIVLLFCLITYIIIKKRQGSKWVIVSIVLAIGLNSYYLFPYAPFGFKAVSTANDKTAANSSDFSIMLANVYMKNRNADGLLAIIKKNDPTILLTVEVDKWWTRSLEVIENSYPYKTIFPTENTYGMALYSKLPLSDTQKYFLNHDSVPTFLSTVTFPNGQKFQLLTVHPVAPKSSKHPDNLNREETGLMLAATTIKDATLPVVVAGDFNDVGWSPNMAKFEEISKLKDIRIGRGLYNTFSAKNILMRWPLDYVYVSPQFSVLAVERLPYFGSDHFPFYAKLRLTNK